MIYYGGLDAGCDLFTCVVGDEEGHLLVREKIATDDPERAMAQVFRFFNNFKIAAIGVSLSPVNIKAVPQLPQLWTRYPIVAKLAEQTQVPLSATWQTNAAAFGELQQGAARGLDGCLYLSVDETINAGLIVSRRFINGVLATDIGHLLLQRHPKDRYDTRQYSLTHLATLPSIEKRWRKPIHLLPPDHIAWEIEADYLTQCVIAYMLIAVPKRIIVALASDSQPKLLSLMRARLDTVLSVVNPSIAATTSDNYIVAPQLGHNARLIGILNLAREAMAKGKARTWAETAAESQKKMI